MDFYICKHCGNIITYAENKGVPVVCCGEPMSLLAPNTTDAANEKHVPVVELNGQTVTVTVGSVEHPMAPEHYIQWIVLETAQGVQGKKLSPGEKPQAVFQLNPGDTVTAAYEFCNLHGLWKK